ncbi:IS110 family RNA-guided transposase [Azotobacter salinestris]|uniref:IS110 family transposase n=1 Tax=Azotobacter salinestris TaxID=69964 RepID=UPI001266A863|nr:IS110 family transposase [Azotobacter salinestris]
MKLKRIGVGLAKQVFQLHGVDSHEQAVCRKQLKRSQALGFFRRLGPCAVAMEACGSAHYWARELSALGHEVRLIAPQFVKPYVKSGKNDANDAEAICEAASRPTMRHVEVKSAEQQASQALHRIRSRLIRARTALVNKIRGLLGEFGLVEIRHGVAATRRLAQTALEDAGNGLPGPMLELLAELRGELDEHEAHLCRLDEMIQCQAREDERVKRLMQVEGIGPVSATALVEAVGNARQFRSARQFAAWLGLVPRQHSSGGKERLGAITKRGDIYLRTLLIHGARAVLQHCRDKADRRSQWLRQLICRRNRNIAAVALANKNARVVWAILSREECYQLG